MSKSLLPTFSGSTVVSGLKCKDFTLKPLITVFFKDNSLYTFYLVLHTQYEWNNFFNLSNFF